jgi:hypothetical protein
LPEPVFVKPGMYIMAPEPIWMAYFINASLRSVCLHVWVWHIIVDMTSRHIMHVFNFTIVDVMTAMQVCLPHLLVNSECVTKVLIPW